MTKNSTNFVNEYDEAEMKSANWTEKNGFLLVDTLIFFSACLLIKYKTMESDFGQNVF